VSGRRDQSVRCEALSSSTPHRGIREQRVHRREVDAGRERVDRRRVLAVGDLDQAELRVVRALADELGVDRDVRR
jgi:hypothetical protein